MKRKTYNNVLKAGKLIQAKGYSEKESLEIAVQKFDELASLKNGMSVEWLIDRMATKTEREGESMKLSESDKIYFKKCGYLDQDIPQIEKAIEVMQYEDENDNYNYEKGAYSTIKFTWDDANRTLNIADREGSFPGMLKSRKFNIVVVDKENGTGSVQSTKFTKSVSYGGKKKSVKL